MNFDLKKQGMDGLAVFGGVMMVTYVLSAVLMLGQYLGRI